MHSVARENLQHYLNAYKHSSKEQGIKLLHDCAEDEKRRKQREVKAATRVLDHVRRKVRVAFAVQAHRDYDGSVDDKSPLTDATISFKTNDFLHIHIRYNKDWWIGRQVDVGSKFGFIPTASRLANYMVSDVEEKPTDTAGQERSVWEPPCPYVVVPTTRPIVLLGPTSQESRLTQLLHLALREEILRQFGDQMGYLRSDIGSGGGIVRPSRWLPEGFRGFVRESRADVEQREVEAIWRMTSRLKLLLVESPNIHTPDDVQHLPIAPMFFLIRVSDTRILLQLLRETNSTRVTRELEVATTLRSMADDKFELVVEEKGLHEATRRICAHLHAYLRALRAEPDV